MKEFKYRVGDKVSHDKFGCGVVVSILVNFGAPYCASFVNPNPKLHNGNPRITGFEHTSDSCWWCFEAELTKLNTFKGNV